MTYQTKDEDLFYATMAELAEAIVELRREIADIKTRIEEVAKGFLP